MLVAVAGTDGSGKTALVAELEQRLTLAGLAVDKVGRWDIVANPAYPAARFMKPGVRDIRRCIGEMQSPTRLFFFFWSMLLAASGKQGAGGETEVTLLDGYWMKHAASEIVYGLDREWVETISAGFAIPDLVMYLRLPPAEAWIRKQHDLTPYECGMDPGCSRSSFVGHQGRIQAVLDCWSELFGWIVIDAARPLSDVAQRGFEEVASSWETWTSPEAEALARVPQLIV